ncbi:MAG: protein kinase, partial [Myxococcota bacterium]|nr:protein kinase [Myxococcota bacterium]
MEALRERFGKYHVLEKIAQGGMAEIYKVKTVGIAGFEKVQALKRILPHSAREGRFIRSFIDEARIAVELTHRNIVQVFDFGKADGELFLAMELIEGKDLRTALGQGVSRDLLPPIGVGAYIISEVAAGLDYAHRKTDGYSVPLGIVHCDVSPSNVMLSSDGYVKILDFGIARASFSTALERRRLRGKPRYMAPEQTLGEPPTAAADVFALGIIAWELFTGLPLYRGADLKSILEAVRRTDPPPIDRLNPQVPPEIVQAVAAALSREPTHRNTAADLATACARAALGGGARALAAWLAELEQRPSRVELPWQPEITSISAPQRPARARPSQRSITASLSSSNVAGSITNLGTNLGANDFGAGTPFPDPVAPEPASTEPYMRPSYASLQLGPALRPSALRLEEATTHHGFDPPVHVPDDTSYDELEVEPSLDEPPTDQPALVGDEPIDDDLGALAVGVQAERRRIVIVAGVLGGPLVEVLRPVTRSLGELAYQRGGVVLALHDDALVVAFGLEVAGEDDVAIAMGWALDAGAMARDAGDQDHGGAIVLRIGARTGVATTTGPDGAARVPVDAIDEARLLAREASAERPMFVGGAGR